MKRIILEKIRPLLHWLRQKAYHALGIYHLVDGSNRAIRNGFSPETQEMIQRIMDQISFLESQVNWRLYGLPGSFGNLRLEIASTLSSSDALINSIQQLCRWYKDANEINELRQSLNCLSPGDQALIVLSHNTSAYVRELRSSFPNLRLNFVADGSDILSHIWKNQLTDEEVLRSSLPAAFSAFALRSMRLIWLSDACARFDALKNLLLLNMAARLAECPDACVGYLRTKARDIVHPSRDLNASMDMMTKWCDEHACEMQLSEDGMFRFKRAKPPV